MISGNKDIEWYAIREKIAQIEKNISEISSALESLIKLKDTNFSGISYKGYPSTSYSSLLLYLQSPVNIKKYIIESQDYWSFSNQRLSDEEVEQYATIKKNKKLEIPFLLHTEKLDADKQKEIYDRFSFKVKRFQDFLHAYSTVDEDIKPIIL